MVPRSVAWFVVVGTFNTAVYYVGYLVLYRLGMPYLTAHLTATGIAMVISYFLNCALTFRIKPSLRTFLLFPLSNLANVVITTVGVRLVVEHTPVDPRVAPVPVALVAIPITYLVTKYLLVGRDLYAEEAAREAHLAGHPTRLEELREEAS